MSADCTDDVAQQKTHVFCGCVQKAETQKAQCFAKQLEDRNVQVHKLRWMQQLMHFFAYQ